MRTGFFSSTPKTLWISVALIVPFLGVIGLLYAAGSGQVVPPPSVAKIHDVEIQLVKVVAYYEQQKLAYGRVESTNQSTLGFELAGKVMDILVDEGDALEPGQVIAKLDTARVESRLAELSAALSKAESDLRLAQLSKKRVVDLVARNLESQQRLDEVTESVQAALAQVNSILAQKQSQQVELDKSVLKAGFSATVVSRPVDTGTVVAAGQPIIVVQQALQYEARVALSSDEAFMLTKDQSYDLIINGQTVLGKLKSIGKQRNIQTRTIDVIFTIEVSHQSEFLPGDLVALSYKKRIDETGTWVPKQALSNGIRGLWTLFVLPSSGQHAVSSKSVEVLYSDNTHSFVRGALNNSDWMVVNGGHRLVPEQMVNGVVVKAQVEKYDQHSAVLGGN